MPLTTPCPFLLVPTLMNKVWGGDRLARFGKDVRPGATVGESWELADLRSTSASGAGGGGVRSVIASGPLAGKTLHDAMTAWGSSLLGGALATPEGDFPLLVKFLDARENLSVQVHPSPDYARRHPDAKLKTECWFILDAAPGAVIYKGIRPGVTARAFVEAITTNRVVDDLIAVPAVPGELHNLPSGTCHALGAGVLVAEVQTPSDTTFRVYDWGRAGRELHVAQAIECIDFGPAPGTLRLAADPRARLVTEFFEVGHTRLSPGACATPAWKDSCLIFMVLAGEGSLRWGGASLDIRLGQTGVVPACLARGATLHAGGSGLACLIAHLAG